MLFYYTFVSGMRWILIMIWLYTFPAGLMGQNTIALPETINYPKHTYKAGTQNWGICQDKNGLMYFANNEGVLCFDGTSWKNYPLPNKTIVRSVAVGADDRIYAGGQDEMGYFTPDNRGILRYHSLNSLVAENNRSFSDVWDIVPVDKSLFFRTTAQIFQLADEKIIAYPASNWLFLGAAGGKVLAQEADKGILRFENNTWVPLIPIDRLPEDFVITAVLETGKDSICFTSLRHGIYLHTKEQFTPIRTADLNRIADYNIYDAVQVGDHFALATNRKGCFIVDRQGGFVQQFSRHDGLQNNNILSIFTDRAGNLWLGLDNGIDFIAQNSPVKTLLPDRESDGAGYSSIIHNHHLYLATTDGVYFAPVAGYQDFGFARSHFTPVASLREQVWNLSRINDRLLAGHHDGFVEIRNGQPGIVDKTTGFWTFQPLTAVLPSPKMVAGCYTGIRIYDCEGEQLTESARVNFESARFVTVFNNQVWISHPYKGIYKIETRGEHPWVAENMNTIAGLPRTGNYIFTVKNRLVVTTETGIYEYDPVEKVFALSTLLHPLLGHLAIRYLHEDKAGNVWFVFDKSLGVIDFSEETPRIVYIPELHQKMVSGFEQVYVADMENVLVGAEKGFFHINYAKYRNQSQEMKVFLRQVHVMGQTDSLLFGGYFADVNAPQLQQRQPSVSYEWNSIRFEFAAPQYEQQSNIEYSFLLKGYDNDWSDWSRKTVKEYNNMPPGTYSFLVKARNNLGKESTALRYSFVIQPPWYKTWWAYVFYGCLLGYGLYRMYRWQKGKFRRQQLRYEEKQRQLRNQHQLELEKSEKEIIQLRNEKLEAEIQHKNKEMASATMHLVKKGELIGRIKEELQKMAKNIEEEKSLEALKKMIRALGEEDKMDKDWEHFTIHFDKAHNDFFVALKEKHKNLTPNELKLCAYLRMNLTTKEMAQMMGISVRGVEISRYRLRKKLQIPTEVSLFTYLLDFHGSAVAGNGISNTTPPLS